MPQFAPTETAYKPLERSVDSLQRVYAVMIALSLTEGVKQLLERTGTEIRVHWDAFPCFLGIVVTVVPFLHGMNRHLDSVYLYIKPANRSAKLLIDFATFLALALLFVSASFAMRDVAICWVLLAAAILLDVSWVWSFHRASGPHVGYWIVGNYVFGLLLAGCAYVDFGGAGPHFALCRWVPFAVCAIRSACDYALLWRFYFPASADLTSAGVAGPGVEPKGALVRFSESDVKQVVQDAEGMRAG